MPFNFKFSKRDGLTRRIAYPIQPTWDILATRIHILYDIPVANIAVAYVDGDGDEVTLNSDPELQDYYQASYKPGQVVKFIIQDLRATRIENKALPETPRSSSVRDTFGNADALGFDIEDDWQPLGGLFIPTVRPESTHAFVEVVNSDVASLSHHTVDTDDESDDKSTVQSEFHESTPAMDKGKGKALDDDSRSTTSVGVHVQGPDSIQFGDVGLFEFSTIPPVDSPRSADEPAVAESTPKATVETLPGSDASVKSSTDTEIAPDPPLPDVNPSSTPVASPSLTNDVATLLTGLMNVIASHPELSEGVRNIFQNTSNGTYWAHHRETISQAADELVQTSGRAGDELRRAEEEAGRRVAAAVGEIFRSVSQAVTHANDMTPAREVTGENTSAPPQGGPRWGWRPPHSYFGQPPQMMRGRGPYPFRSSWHNGPQLHRGPPPPPGVHHPGEPPASSPAPPPGLSGPSGPSATGPRGGPSPPPGHFGGHSYGPPPPGAYEGHLYGPPPHAPPHMQGWSSWQPPPITPPHPERPKPTPQELRAQVEAAKLLYKAEKERYRAERDERKKEKELKMLIERNAENHNSQTAAVSMEPEPEPVHIISNARGPYPQLEMFSVPQRHNTHPGHGRQSAGRRHTSEQSDLNNRAINRIHRRLADMGFTENGYPTLPGKIKAQLPANGITTKEAEDNIVTTLLEELLITSPKPAAPVASGSGQRDEDIPGAWM